MSYENAHAVTKGDPRIDGPYLDDIRAAQEEEYRRQRMAGVSQVRHEDEDEKKDVVTEARAASQIEHDESRKTEVAAKKAASAKKRVAKKTAKKTAVKES